MDLRCIAVGEPCRPVPPGGWTDGASWFEWRRGAMELFLSLDSPTPVEVQAARTGKVQVGVRAGAELLTNDAVLLLYRVDGLASGDAPFEVALVPEAERPDLTPLSAGQRYLLTIILVDSLAGGLVRAIRAVSLSHRVSEALRAAVSGERWESVELEDAGV